MSQEFKPIQIDSIEDLVQYVMTYYTKPFDIQNWINNTIPPIPKDLRHLEVELNNRYQRWQKGNDDSHTKISTSPELKMLLDRIDRYKKGWEDWFYLQFTKEVDTSSYNSYSLAETNFIRTELSIRHLIKKWNELTKEDDKSENTSSNEDNDETRLNIRAIPKWSLSDRYYTFSEHFQLFDKINELVPSRSSKHKLIALILDCSVDNAKKLLNGNYRPLVNMSDDRKDELKEYLLKLEIKDINP